MTQVITAFCGIAAVALSSITSYAAIKAVDVSQRQANSSQSQVDESLQHEITERFSAAVGQLGSDAESVRLGGIYALQRIALDSSRDQDTVINVLCGFVRQNAAFPLSVDPATLSVSTSNSSRATLGQSKTDIQAALTVVSRREVKDRPADHINLSHTNLKGAEIGSLSDLNPPLNGVISSQMRNADLSGADLAGARLESVDFADANFSGVILQEAKLQGLFPRAKFTGANLNKVHSASSSYFKGAIFSGSSMIQADLSGADLSESVMRKTNLAGSQLGGARLPGAQLTAAVLTGARLAGSDLSRADLSDAHLVNADLGGANLNGTQLAGADLSGANLSDARGVTTQQLVSAKINESTKLPPGFIVTPTGVQHS